MPKKKVAPKNVPKDTINKPAKSRVTQNPHYWALVDELKKHPKKRKLVSNLMEKIKNGDWDLPQSNGEDHLGWGPHEELDALQRAIITEFDTDAEGTTFLKGAAILEGAYWDAVGEKYYDEKYNDGTSKLTSGELLIATYLSKIIEASRT
jgi:hypothetical protein